MKRSMRWCAALLATFLLTGCIAQQLETTIQVDGSGTIVNRSGFTKAAAQQMEAAGSGSDSASPADEMRKTSEAYPAEWDAQVADWENDKFTGAELTLKFANLQMLNAQLATLFQASSTNTSSPIFASPVIKDENDQFVLDTDVLFSTDDLAQTGSSPDMFKDAEVYWQITLPGSIVSAEPKDKLSIDGNTVKINVPLTENVDYHVTVVANKTGGASVGGLSLPLILGIVFGVMVPLGLVVAMLKRRKATAAAATGYDPNPGYGQQPGTYDPNPGYGQQPGTYDPNPGYGQQPGGYSTGGQPAYAPPTTPGQPAYTPPTTPGQPAYTPPTAPVQPAYTPSTAPNPSAQMDDVNKTTRFAADDVNKTTRFAADDVNKTTRFAADDVNKTTRFAADDVNKTTRFAADDVNKTTRFAADDVNKTTRLPTDSDN